tara:strand:- start:811 stop:1038 length:228 start_codon:yes stop_codon:yes gene_type:complete
MGRYLHSSGSAHAGRFSLPGNGSDPHASKMADICQELEIRGESGSFDQVAELLAEVETEYARAKDALKEYLDGGE